jgi:hypothetical protein
MTARGASALRWLVRGTRDVVLAVVAGLIQVGGTARPLVLRLRRSHLDLSALDAHLERRLRRGRRPLHNRSVEAEGTAVAGTDDRVVFQLALVQRAAAV